MQHKTHEQLEKELSKAAKKVKIGGIYSHYKHPENLYKVIGLGFREETDDLCVIYRAEYNKDLVFIRELESWLEKPGGVERFKLIK